MKKFELVVIDMNLLLSHISDLYNKKELPEIKPVAFEKFKQTLEDEIEKVSKEETLYEIIIKDNPLTGKRFFLNKNMSDKIFN